MAADGHTDNFHGLASFLIILFLSLNFYFFFQKVQHKVLDLEIQLILSILCVLHLKIGPKSKILWLKLGKHKSEMKISYNQNCFTNT